MLAKLAWKQIWHRPFQSFILIFITALAIGLSVLILSVGQGLHQGLVRATEPFTLLVGAKGSSNQLVINSVFLQDQPIGNISYSEVERLRAQKDLVQSAIPLGFGDNYNGYRIVGTEKEIFDVKPNPKDPNWLRIASGRVFQAPYEVVIGAETARQAKLKVGDKIESIHGISARGQAHKDNPYTIVGILEPVDGPYDQAILTEMESIWHSHAHPSESTAPRGGVIPPTPAEKTGTAAAAAGADGIAEDHDHDAEEDGQHHADDESAEAHSEHANEQVTAIMVQPVGYGQAFKLALQYQSSKEAQLVFPAQVIVRLFSMMGQGEKIWLPVGVIIIGLALLVVVLSSYLASLNRLREQAVMKALGATQGDIMTVSFWQNTFLIVLGGIAGWLIGEGAYRILASVLANSTAISMSKAFMWQPIALMGGTVAAGILISLIPAYMIKKKDINSYL